MIYVVQRNLGNIILIILHLSLAGKRVTTLVAVDSI